MTECKRCKQVCPKIAFTENDGTCQTCLRYMNCTYHGDRKNCPFGCTYCHFHGDRNSCPISCGVTDIYLLGKPRLRTNKTTKMINSLPQNDVQIQSHILKLQDQAPQIAYTKPISTQQNGGGFHKRGIPRGGVLSRNSKK